MILRARSYETIRQRVEFGPYRIEVLTRGLKGQDVVAFHQHAGKLTIGVFDGNGPDGDKIATKAGEVTERDLLRKSAPDIFLTALRKKLASRESGGTTMTCIELFERPTHDWIQGVAAGDSPPYYRNGATFVSPGEHYTYVLRQRRIVRTDTLTLYQYAETRHAILGGIIVEQGVPTVEANYVEYPQLYLPVGGLAALATDGLSKILGIGTDPNGRVIDPNGCADLAEVLRGVRTSEAAIQQIQQIRGARELQASRGVYLPGLRGTVYFNDDDFTVVVIQRVAQ